MFKRLRGNFTLAEIAEETGIDPESWEAAGLLILRRPGEGEDEAINRLEAAIEKPQQLAGNKDSRYTPAEDRQ